MIPLSTIDDLKRTGQPGERNIGEESVNRVQANTIPGLLDARVAASPDLPAYSSRDQSGVWQVITWADYYRQVRIVARALHHLSLATGDCVLILAQTGQDWELAQMSVLGCGAVAVGVDPRASDEHLFQIIESVEPAAAILGDVSLLARLPRSVAANLKCCVTFEQLPGPAGDNVISLAELKSFSAPAVVDPWGSVKPEDLATIVFTSGTTGVPKGIAYGHAQVCSACHAMAETFPEIGEGGRLVCWLPLSNLFQRMLNFFAIVQCATTYFVNDPRQIMESLPDIRPHMLIGVPRFYEKLHEGMMKRIDRSGWLKPLLRLAVKSGEAHALSVRTGIRPKRLDQLLFNILDPLVLSRFRRALGGNLRFLISGSAPIPVWLLERLHGIGLLVLEAYGTSENIIPIAANRPSAFRFGTVGPAMPGNEIRIDAEGELQVRGDGVFNGYLHDPDRRMFTEDGFLKTGDYAEVTRDGFVRLKGRRSDIFKTSTGRRIPPFGIEQRLLQISWVDYAIAVGSGRKYVVVLLAVSSEALKGHAAGREMSSDDREGLLARLGPVLWEDVTRAVADLPKYEQPVGVALTLNPFTVEAGELTANLKLRRAYILDKYGSCLDELYNILENGDPNSRVIVCP